MHQTYILLGFYTVLLAIIYQIMKSLVAPEAAFLTAAAVTTGIFFSIIGVTEGLSHDTHFDALQISGSVRVRPNDNFDQSTLLEFSATPNQIYSITGRTYGSINERPPEANINQ